MTNSSMAAHKMRKKPRSPRNAQAVIDRLQAQVACLEAEVQKLKGNSLPEARGTKPNFKNPILAHDFGPPLPPPNAEGMYPAFETLDVILARQMLSRRLAVGWTQAELARRSGVRPETISRLESGKNSPNVATVDRIVAALNEGEKLMKSAKP